MTRTPHERAREAYAERERKAGRPLRVPHGPAVEHRDKLRALGMTDHRIAEAADANGYPMHQTTVSTLTRTSRIHRDTEAGVLSVGLDEAEACDSKLVPVIGVARAIGALMLKGYSLNWISRNCVYEQVVEERSPSNRCYAHALLSGRHRWVRFSTFRRVYQMAQKFDLVNPEDLDLPRQSTSRARNYAAKRGYVPLSCWDEDTINDPEAVPEWTGACGTDEGYRIHIRESLAGRHLPPCGPCRDVVEVVLPGHRGAAGELPFEFLVERFRERLDERGTNPRQLAIKLGRDPKHSDRFYRWLAGDRQPRNRGEVHAIAKALDLDPGELMRDLRPDEEGKRLIGQPGGFNPFVFRAVIEAAEWTQVRAGKACDVSGTTVAKWIRGEHAPGSKAIIQPLADELGLDVRIFYP